MNTRVIFAFALTIILSTCSEIRDSPNGFEQTALTPIPRDSQNVHSEIVRDDISQYYFMSFEADSKKIELWLNENKNLKPASVETVFERCLVVLPDKEPGWFKQSQTSNIKAMYYWSKEDCLIFTLVLIDKENNMVKIESRQRLKSPTAHYKAHDIKVPAPNNMSAYGRSTS